MGPSTEALARTTPKRVRQQLRRAFVALAERGTEPPEGAAVFAKAPEKGLGKV